MRTEFYKNTLCIEGGWLIEANIMSESNYKTLTKRKWLNVLRRGCKGTPSLVEFDTIPQRFKDTIISRYGDPHRTTKHYFFRDRIFPDAKAATYYSEYKLNDGGNLPEKTQRKYRANAEILNAIHEIVSKKSAQRRALGGSAINKWQKLSNVVNALDKEYFKHDLPTNPQSLQRRYSKYKKEGYNALIHKGFCNVNSRKVTFLIEKIILSLYVHPEKPYGASVHEMYMQFLGGAIDVVDIETGEVFNRKAFYDDKNEPIVISERTVLDYINNPKNRIIVDRYRNDSLSFSSTHRPHNHRHAPNYSLSKISMDDRDLPRKMHDGNRVKAYYSYDITSGIIIGASYSKRKDRSLFIDCMRDMFRFLNSNGLGIPMEVEVEHHLVNTFKEDLMKAGLVFPFVRWANAGNSQEKWAETGNRLKKYGFEKKHQVGIGRFYSKLEANRPRQDKIWTDKGMQTKAKTYDYETLVADDRQTIAAYNNALHHNQKKYKGMTKLEVFLANISPDLAQYNNALLARYIGEETKTTVRRSQYVRVQYRNFSLPSPEVMAMLKPHNRTVMAYYLPNQDGTIDEVYLYQNNEFICACSYLETYNTATAERTHRDEEIRLNQAAYTSKFDKMVRSSKKVIKTEIVKNTIDYSKVKAEIIEEKPSLPREVKAGNEQKSGIKYHADYFSLKAIDNL